MTLYTLGIKRLNRQRKIFIIASIVCLIFAIIYESFSHGVVSNYMIYAFAIPFIMGAGMYSIFKMFKIKKLPNKFENRLYNGAIATFTIGSIIEGVLEIYGTTNWKVYIYLYAGIILLASSITSYILRKDTRQ